MYGVPETGRAVSSKCRAETAGGFLSQDLQGNQLLYVTCVSMLAIFGGHNFPWKYILIKLVMYDDVLACFSYDGLYTVATEFLFLLLLCFNLKLHSLFLLFVDLPTQRKNWEYKWPILDFACRGGKFFFPLSLYSSFIWRCYFFSSVEHFHTKNLVYGQDLKFTGFFYFLDLHSYCC